MKLLKVSLRVGEAATCMRLGSLAATFSHSSLPDLERSLLNKLIVVLVLLRNRGESIIIVQRLHLLMHHLVLRPIDVALKEVTQV